MEWFCVVGITAHVDTSIPSSAWLKSTVDEVTLDQSENNGQPARITMELLFFFLSLLSFCLGAGWCSSSVYKDTFAQHTGLSWAAHKRELASFQSNRLVVIVALARCVDNSFLWSPLPSACRWIKRPHATLLVGSKQLASYLVCRHEDVFHWDLHSPEKHLSVGLVTTVVRQTNFFPFVLVCESSCYY